MRSEFPLLSRLAAALLVCNTAVVLADEPLSTPTPRIDYAIAYFPTLGGIVMHGGWGDPDWNPLSEIWLLTGQGWSQLPDGGGPALSHHAMTYDADRSLLVVCGRIGFGGTYMTWEYDGAMWTAGPDIPLGSGINGDVEVAYDSARGRTVLYAAGWDDSVETWEYDGTTWTQKNPAHEPVANADGALLQYDPNAGGVLLLTFTPVAEVWIPQTWIWDGTDWTEVDDPSGLDAVAGAMAFDAKRDEMVLLTSEMQTWTFDGTAWTQETPFHAPTPSPLGYFFMAHDPVRQRTAFFGGESYVPPDSFVYPDTTWEWDGSDWAVFAPGGGSIAGTYEAVVDADAVATNGGFWDLSGHYECRLDGNSLVLELTHDSRGRLTGSATLTPAGKPAFSIPLKVVGAVKGAAGAVAAKISLKGSRTGTPTTPAAGRSSASVALGLAMNAATGQLGGTASGSVKLGTVTAAFRAVPLTLDLPDDDMDGTYSLLLHLNQTGTTVSGDAVLTLSNDSQFRFKVQGRTVGQQAAIVLSGSADDAPARGLTLKTTVGTLEGGWATLDAFAGKLFGQTLLW